MIDTIDTIDTAEFRMARNLVSIPLLTIDTIDTGHRHQASTPGRRVRPGMGCWGRRRGPSGW